MTQFLSRTQLDGFRRLLRNRLSELQQGLREELIRSDNEHFTDVAGEVHDPEEASVANLVIDLDLANIDRHVQEVREIETALIRIGSGEFGICLDCDQPIPQARLEANPTAERCISCQTDYERVLAQHAPGGEGPVSL